MAPSIRPPKELRDVDDSRNARKLLKQTKEALDRRAAGRTDAPREAGAEKQGETRPVVIERVHETSEPRRSQKLLNASISVAKKQDLTEEMLKSTDSLLTKAKQLRSEKDPARQEKLAFEAKEVQLRIKQQYAQAVDEDSAVAAEEQVADAQPSPAGKAGFSLSIPAAQSPEAAGLGSVSVTPESAPAAISQLEHVKESLTGALDSFRTASAAIAEAARQRQSDPGERTDAAAMIEKALSVAHEIKRSLSADNLPHSAGIMDAARLVEAEEPKATAPGNRGAESQDLGQALLNPAAGTNLAQG